MLISAHIIFDIKAIVKFLGKTRDCTFAKGLLVPIAKNLTFFLKKFLGVIPEIISPFELLTGP